MFDVQALIAGGAGIRWEPSNGARIGVLDRADLNAPVRWFDMDPFWMFHVLNAHDDGDGRCTHIYCDLSANQYTRAAHGYADRNADQHTNCHQHSRCYGYRASANLYVRAAHQHTNGHADQHKYSTTSDKYVGAADAHAGATSYRDQYTDGN